MCALGKGFDGRFTLGVGTLVLGVVLALVFKWNILYTILAVFLIGGYIGG